MSEISAGDIREMASELLSNMDPPACVDAVHMLRILATEREQAAQAGGVERDAARWRALLEMDGGAIYHLLGDYDGMRPEFANARIDAMRSANGGEVES